MHSADPEPQSPGQPLELAAIERGAGVPVVLVHGGIFHSGPAWGRNIHPIAAAGYRVIAVDRRGHGRTPSGGAERVPVRLQADDLLHTLHARSVPPAHLVGVSYGCLICLEFALTWPGRVRSLVLNEPPLFSWIASDPDYREWYGRLRQAHARSREGAGVEEWLPDFMRLIDARMAAELTPRSPAWRLIRRHIPQSTREQRSWDYHPDEASLENLDVPALIVNGDQSEPVMQVIGQTLSAVLPRSTHAFIPGAGHDSHARHAEEFNRRVLHFISDH